MADRRRAQRCGGASARTMNLGMFIAVCTLLNYVAKLLDDFYLSANVKLRAVEGLNGCYKRINGLNSLAVVEPVCDFALRAKARYYWYAEKNIIQAMFFAVFLFVQIIGFVLAHVFIEIQYSFIEIVVIWIFSMFLAVLARLIYSLIRSVALECFRFSDNTVLRNMYVPFVISVVAIMFLSAASINTIVVNKLFFSDALQDNWLSYVAYILIYILCSSLIIILAPFFLVSLLLLLLLIVKTIIATVDSVSGHFAKIAAITQKPFGYTAALVTVALAILKIVEEYKA
jgi:hypothetical protein